MIRILLPCLMMMALFSPAQAGDPATYRLVYGILFEGENHVHSKELTCPTEHICRIDENPIHMDVEYADHGDKVNINTPEIITLHMKCDTFNCTFATGRTILEVTEFGTIVEMAIQQGRPDLAYGPLRYLRVETRKPLAEFYVKIIR